MWEWIAGVEAAAIVALVAGLWFSTGDAPEHDAPYEPKGDAVCADSGCICRATPEEQEAYISAAMAERDGFGAKL